MIGKVSTFLGPNGLFQGVSGTPSLVLSLDSNNILSYPGTGVTWSDLSIRKNNGLLNNITSVTGSIPSTSLSFDGSTSYISFTQSDGIPSGNSEYTIEAWFNSNSYGPSEQGAIVGWGTTGVDNEANVLRLDQNGVTNYWWNNDCPVVFSGTSSMIEGNWYYVVVTYDGTVRKIYLNGELKGGDTPTGVHSVSDTSTLKIGHFYTNYFNGEISKVKISDKALSDSRILSNFNADKIQHGYVFGSMTFDVTQSSYLSSSSSDYVFGKNDFTIEAFFKASTSSNSYGGVFSIRDNSDNYPGIWVNTKLANTSTPLIQFFIGRVSQKVSILSYTASSDKWYHVAISRTGGTSSFFVNGEHLLEFNDVLNYVNSDLVIGEYYTSKIGTPYNYFNGIISNVRVINGTGLYTGTFSVPDVQLSATSNTKLLITSQQTTPSADVSGLLHSVTASNIGWTSSLPYIAPSYITDHLELYVDAGLPSSYPGSGSSLYDLSLNRFDMTIGTGSTWGSTVGGVIDFDGSYSGQVDLDGPVSGLNIVTITHLTGYTMETMVKFNSVSGSQGIFTFCGNVWGSSGYINLQLDNSSLRWEAVSGSGGSFFPKYTFVTGTWYHIIATYDGSFLVVYVNGVMVGSSSLSGSINRNTTAKFTMGMWDGPLNGSIGFVRFYSKPLLADDVTNNFNANKYRFGL